MGKQNRGRYNCVSVVRSAAPALTAEQRLTQQTAARSASARMPVEQRTGQLATPWIGPQWSANKLGITPKQDEPTLEQLRASGMPGLSELEMEGSGVARALELDAAAEGEAMADDDESATPKKPVTSMSRRSVSGAGGASSRAASRAQSRVGTPLPSAPASPTLRAQATPSRTPAAGAAWKSKTLRKSWSAKREQRDAFLSARTTQRRLAETDAEERRSKARAAKQKADLKLANEKKNQVVQVISDTRKIKNMSRKQLRSVVKMDTGGFKTKAVTSGGLSRGLVPKGE